MFKATYMFNCTKKFRQSQSQKLTKVLSTSLMKKICWETKVFHGTKITSLTKI